MLVGFHGIASSGKDTSATRMALQVPDEIEVEFLLFADKLKDSSAALLGIPRELIEENKNNPDARILIQIGWVDSEIAVGYDAPGIVKALTFREFWQRYGTESHRDIFDPDFWVKATLPDDFDHEGRLVFITDVRFPNELEQIHKLGGYVIHVLGGNEPEIVWDGDVAINAETGEEIHPSEIPLEGCDTTIYNHIRGDDFYSLDAQLNFFLFITAAKMVRVAFDNADEIAECEETWTPEQEAELQAQAAAVTEKIWIPGS